MKKGAGALDQRVTLDLAAYTAKDGGGAEVKFTSKINIWAGIEPISMNGRFQNYAVEITATHVLKVRRNPIITIGSRITWGTRKLYIRAEMIGDKAYQFFSCEEVV